MTELNWTSILYLVFTSYVSFLFLFLESLHRVGPLIQQECSECLSFFLSFFFFLACIMHSFIFILFIYLFLVVFVIHWHESAMDIHVFPIPIPPPTSLSTRSLWVFPLHQVRALVSCILSGLVICFTLDNIHVSMLFSWNIPPSPSPTESKSLWMLVLMPNFNGKNLCLTIKTSSLGFDRYHFSDQKSSLLIWFLTTFCRESTFNFIEDFF